VITSILYLMALSPLVALTLAGLVRECLYWRSGGELDEPRGSVSVIMPLKGIDLELEENIRAVLEQEYPHAREYIFAVDSTDDPAVKYVEGLGKVVVVGEGALPGKSNALAKALEYASGDYVVFVDSDARPHRRWLYNLTSLLNRYPVSTSYRWYLPRNFCSWLKLNFSNIGFTMMLSQRTRFPWGGSVAIRRDLLERSRLREWIKYYVSDDYAVYKAVKECGGAIGFARNAVVGTVDSCKFGEFVEWAVRQLLMVKWHSYRGWAAGLATYTINILVGLILPIIGLATGNFTLAVGLIIPALNLIKDLVRARGVLKHNELPGDFNWLAYVVACLLGNLTIPTIFWISAFRRCTSWRGRRYCVEDVRRLKELSEGFGRV